MQANGRSGCGATRRVLWEFVAERLAEGPMEAVERHLAGCAGCRREAEATRAAHALLTASADCAPEPPTGWSALRARIEVEAERGNGNPRLASAPDASRFRPAPARSRGEWRRVGLASGLASALLISALGWRTAENVLVRVESRSPMQNEANIETAGAAGANRVLRRAENAENRATQENDASLVATWNFVGNNLPQAAESTPKNGGSDPQNAGSNGRTGAFEAARGATPTLQSVGYSGYSGGRSAKFSSRARSRRSEALAFQPYHPARSEQAPRAASPFASADGLRLHAQSAALKPIANAGPRFFVMGALEPVSHDDDSAY